jgi:hypothetical protein
MATKYDDIIKIREGKAAYDISEEKKGAWQSFIPNVQFNEVLRTVIKSVRGYDIDFHKSFWIHGTYGTGKSHAVAVISHLLGDPVEEIREWVDYEYKDDKFATIRQDIYKLRESKRLLTVKLNGLSAMTHSGDFALVLQKAVVQTLKDEQTQMIVKTDFENFVQQIRSIPNIWQDFIDSHKELNNIVSNCDDLVALLSKGDMKTYHAVNDVLRDVKFDIRLDNDNIKQWLADVESKLCEQGTYNGMLIVWDEFTDVMNDAIGVQILKELQTVAQMFMNIESNSYFFLISHPSAFNNLGSDNLKQTDGRYHRMQYNMEPVSAFKIMSRKFEIVNDDMHSDMCRSFYEKNPQLLEIFTSMSNDQQSTREDLFNLFPLHPGTANLATHYATVVGSSCRSVFEFLGQNEEITSFLHSEEHFRNHDTITADYLWDFVLKVFQDDITNYGAVTERYNSYRLQVGNQEPACQAVFKGILLLNAFNNLSGENNFGLVTPSEENIRNIFAGTCYADQVDGVLNWFNEEGIIQRAPGGLYSVQFSALPSAEIEDKKTEMRNVEYNYTSKILQLNKTAETYFRKKILQTAIRPYGVGIYSDEQNKTVLKNKIDRDRKNTKSSSLFFALFMAKNYGERAILQGYAEEFTTDEMQCNNVVFIVFDEIFTDAKYDQFIEYQANYACASSHGFLDQQKVHQEHAIGMVRDWMDTIQRGNATLYLGKDLKHPFSVRHFGNIVNTLVSPFIFKYSPDSIDVLRRKASNTFWKQQNSKEIVRTFIFSDTKDDLLKKLNSQTKSIQYLIQDCLDDNMEWKPDAKEHPFKAIFDKVQSILKYADKSAVLNLDKKFSLLTEPPYGLYSNYASMATMAFALKPWAGKICDMQGKPRDKNALIDDIVLLFKVWDDGKSNSKLDFKLESTEENKLCKSLVSLFKLNSFGDVNSFTEAKHQIVRGYCEKKGYPLWVLKYVSDDVFDGLPISSHMTADKRKLIDNIVKLCSESTLQGKAALVTGTLDLISSERSDMIYILKSEDAVFAKGFRHYLIQLEDVNIQEDEVGEVYGYLKSNLQDSIGYWTEEQVKEKAKSWKIEKLEKLVAEKKSKQEPDEQGYAPISHSVDVAGKENAYHPDNYAISDNKEILGKKRTQIRERIAKISSLDEARSLLNRFCEICPEWVFDKIKM